MTRMIRSWLESLFDLLTSFPADAGTLTGPLGGATYWYSLERVLEQARGAGPGELG